MYRIYMYNAWFGDCFKLKDGKKNLFVDFGIHNMCMKGGISVAINNYSSGRVVNRDDVHEAIAKEMALLDEAPDLLVTHYHLDHLSGLLYMKDSSSYRSSIFSTVYLPNIWNFPDSKNIVALLILEGLMNNCKLNKKGCSLLEFIRFLCTSVRNVELLKRGDEFDGGNFIALWPEPECINIVAKQLIMSEELDLARRIINIAEELINIVISLASREINAEIKELNLIRIDNLLRRVEGFYNEEMLNRLSEKEYDVVLNSFGNNISIVFQNVISTDNNMLFTGDLEAEYLSMLSNNYDKKLPMHEKYKYIKIPHHGTRGSKDSHYYSFLPYSPDIFMFPNGECVLSSYKICKKYEKDIRETAEKGIIKVYCSNSNWCEMNSTGRGCDCGCGASVNKIIFPDIFLEVI